MGQLVHRFRFFADSALAFWERRSLRLWEDFFFFFAGMAGLRNFNCDG